MPIITLSPRVPFSQLRVWEEAPVLPVGYIALVDMVIANNDEFIRIAKGGTTPAGVGPLCLGIRPRESGVRRCASAPATHPATRIESDVAENPGCSAPLALLVLVSLGGWSFSGSHASLGAVFVRNAVIAGLFVGLFFFRNWLESRVQNGWISWGVGLLLLFVVGTSTQGFLG